MPSPCIKPRLKAIIASGLVLFFIIAGMFLSHGAAAALPTTEVASVPETVIATKNWLSEAYTYVRNKVATIAFQNIIRNVLNDFAKDAATYVASGGSGQQSLVIKQKWGNFWQNVGDKAAGDFVQTLADSILADVKADDIAEKSLEKCGKQRDKCYNDGKLKPADCESNYNNCMLATNSSADSSCVVAKEKCQKICYGTYEISGADECLQNCDTAFSKCAANTSEKRKAPMLDKGTPLGRFNICRPEVSWSIAVTLGLMNYNTDYTVDCSFTEMLKNWDDAFQRAKYLASPEYLQTVAKGFNAGGNDLFAVLELQTNLIGDHYWNMDVSQKETAANGGWLDVRNFAGDLVGTPGESKQLKELTEQALWDNLGKVTGDILVDAANIFLNQAALVGWQKLIGSLSEQSGPNLDAAGSWSGTTAGRTAIEAKINQLTEPVFSEPGKLDIVSRLSSCQDPQNPGPTDCVISNQFADAINGKMTVLEALNSGRLPRDWPFGFTTTGEDKLSYNQGYPYRSLIILRKYNILPVGWEVAAQKIQLAYSSGGSVDDKLPERPSGVTLGDMVNCYQKDDNLTGYFADWCEGLVDPYWVLDVPDYYCAAKGYGPTLAMDPTQIDTGIKYCSSDNGTTIARVDDEERECAVDSDCCSDDENATRENIMENGNSAALKAFRCGAACTYKERKLTVSRTNDYCADEQSCIKQGENGNCQFYGYCIADRRKWTFSRDGNDKICLPYESTCAAYQGPSGKAVNFLNDTLDFSTCNADNVGCAAYALTGQYDSLTNGVAWVQQPAIHLNAKTKTCSASQEGCSSFIRLAEPAGVNLFPDGSFENGNHKLWGSYGQLMNSQTEGAQIYQGDYSLRVLGGKGIAYGPNNLNLLPKGFEFEVDQTYTLSAMIYTVSGEAEMGIGKASLPDNVVSIKSTVQNGWEEFILTIDNDFTLNADSFYIKGAGQGADFYIDNVKLEIGSHTQFGNYGDVNSATLKFMPEYLSKTCYNNPPNDYSLKDDAPAVCAKFARRCNKDEVGCQLFTDDLTKDQLAAKVKPKDQCPSECVGYEAYIRRANTFYDAREDYFIPRTAKTCPASAVGCTQFVNLDKLKEGGEANEYYSKLRQCSKPDGSCDQFYTWEGSSESGFQLMTYSLKAGVYTAENGDQAKQPVTSGDDNSSDNYDAGRCDDAIFGLPADHPDYNPDCRQFYSKDGHVSFHLYSETVVCSDNCHPYRLVTPNINALIDNNADCASASGHWRENDQSCVICQGGGSWDEEHQSCLYLAVPNEGVVCSANHNGCSEFAGNFSNKVKTIFNDTFEAGSELNGWGQGANDVSVASEALTRGGHSVHTRSNSLSKSFDKLEAGMKYELSFLAKTKNQNDFIKSIYLAENNLSNDGLVFSGRLNLTGDWRLYKFNISDLLQAVNQIYFSFNSGDGSNIYFDNIKLTKVDDKYYLLKNSWTTPESCDKDFKGNPFPFYMLGCRQYTNQDGKKFHLRSFDSLCQESGVGCELMIDTKNSSVAHEQTFYDKTTDAESAVTVPADEIAYIVFDQSKLCSTQDKGCSRLGKLDNDIDRYKDAYILNNPDTYYQTLCKASEVGCAAWSAAAGGQAYFKNPGDKTCEYRQWQGQGTYAWLKKKQSYCFATEEGDQNRVKACSNDSDCSQGQICVAAEDNNKYCRVDRRCKTSADCASAEQCMTVGEDEACQLDYHKTVGLGNAEQKAQPVGVKIDGYAGVCGNSAVGCSEYIDPDSRINPNLLDRYQSGEQVNLDYNKLYVIKAGKTGGANVACSVQAGDDLRILDDKNNLTSISGNSVSAQTGFSEEFYVFNQNASAGAKVKCSVTGQASSLVEAVIGYRLAESLNQNRPNNVDFVKAAILFNQRSYSSSGWSSLTANTNLSLDGQAPQPASTNPPGNNANQLLQVDPARECSQWLGCKSYGANPLDQSGKDKICYERGVCDQLNEAGECVHFVNATPEGLPVAEQTMPDNISPSAIANLTGYSKVGYKNNVWTADLFHMADMFERGSGRVNFDGSFERDLHTGFAILDQSGKPTVSMAPVIRDAAIMEKELGLGGYKNIPDGQAIGKAVGCVARDIDNVPDADNIISAYVYLRTGSKASLYADNQLLGQTSQSGGWVRLIGRFQEAGNTVNLKLCSDGVMYFDQILISSGLQVRNNTYIHPSCRLYPKDDSLSCDYYDSDDLRRKGWQGYCLETDPRNSNVCLLWYPLDKVSAEDFEEGAAIDIGKDVYYCLYANDKCSDSTENPTQPEFYCSSFVKVDKTKYWYTRVQQGSGFVFDNRLLRNDGKQTYIDMGIDTATKLGGRTDITYKQSLASGLYGAYLSGRTSLDGYDKPATFLLFGSGNNKVPLPFYAFAGYSTAGAWSNGDNSSGSTPMAYCKATLDSSGIDRPFEVSAADEGNNAKELGKFDDCYVRATTEWDDEDCSENCCGTWNATTDSCSNKDTDYFQTCDDSGIHVCRDTNPRQGFRCAIYRSRGYSILNPTVDLLPTCAIDTNPEANCWAVQKDKNGNPIDKWTGFAMDAAGSDFGNAVGCFFDCFNHTEAFYGAQVDIRNNRSGSTPVKHIFPVGSEGYIWNQDSRSYYKYSENSVYGELSFNITGDNQCPGNIRPDAGNLTYNNWDAELCFVKPTVGSFKANLSVENGYYIIHRSAWAQFNFASIVDKDQQPLKKYSVDWGYADSRGVKREFVRTGNMYPRSQANPHTVYHFYDYKLMNQNSPACLNGGRLARPSVRIEDNWNSLSDSKQMDLPVCVLPD